MFQNNYGNIKTNSDAKPQSAVSSRFFALVTKETCVCCFFIQLHRAESLGLGFTPAMFAQTQITFLYIHAQNVSYSSLFYFHATTYHVCCRACMYLIKQKIKTPLNDVDVKLCKYMRINCPFVEQLSFVIPINVFWSIWHRGWIKLKFTAWPYMYWLLHETSSK